MDATRIDTIRRLYGSVASELLPIEKSFEELNFKANGLISNANYNTKRMTLLLFINRKC